MSRQSDSHGARGVALWSTLGNLMSSGSTAPKDWGTSLGPRQLNSSSCSDRKADSTGNGKDELWAHHVHSGNCVFGLNSFKKCTTAVAISVHWPERGMDDASVQDIDKVTARIRLLMQAFSHSSTGSLMFRCKLVQLP